MFLVGIAFQWFCRLIGLQLTLVRNFRFLGVLVTKLFNPTLLRTLFYQQSDSNTCYGHKPSGELDLQRLIDNKAAWVQLADNLQEKPRVLILSDDLLPYSTPESKKHFAEILKNLCLLGFRLYASTQIGLKPLSGSDLDERDCFDDIVSMPVELLMESAGKLRISQDSLKVMDEYWRYCLQDNEVLTDKCLYASELIEAEKQGKEAVIEGLSARFPSNITIVADELGEKSLGKVTTLLERFPEALLSYKKLICNRDQLVSLLASESQPIVINGLTFSAQMLVHLKKIEVDEITVEDLKTLLVRAPKLKFLKVKKIDKLNKKSLTPNALMNLEEINYTSAKAIMPMLNILLQSAPKLKKFSVGFNCLLKDPILLTIQGLTQLEEVDLSHSRIKVEDLPALLEVSPHLKKISFGLAFRSQESAINSQTLNALEDALKKVSGLEEIDFRDSSLSMSYTTPFFTFVPSLKLIRVGENFQVTAAIIEALKALTVLEEIDLSKTNITLKALEQILKALPSIKRISIKDDCLVTEEKLKLEKGCLQQLETIDFVSQYTVKKNSITQNKIEIIKTLLKAAPKLEKCPNIQNRLITLNNNIKANTSNINESTSNTNINYSSNTPSPLPSTAFTPDISPEHESSRYKDFKPHDESASFVFEKGLSLKNQSMLINKLSQYLTLKGKDLAWVPKIQDGICFSLSLYFKNYGFEAIEALLEEALQWQGHQYTLSSSLSSQFDALISMIKAYENKEAALDFYMGELLPSYLEALEVNKGCLLENPWHAVYVEKISQDQYRFYDPNADGVVGALPLTALLTKLQVQLGDLIGINAPESDIKKVKTLKNVDEFIAEGGLLVLCVFQNYHEQIIDEIDKKISQLDSATLQGLLLRTTSGTPAWAVAIQDPNQKIRRLAHSLLQRFKVLYGEKADQILAQSLEATSQMKQHVLAENLLSSQISENSVEDAAAIEEGGDNLNAISEVSCEAQASTGPQNEGLLTDIVRLTQKQADNNFYRDKLSPWKHTSKTSDIPALFYQSLLKPVPQGLKGNINRLVRCQTDASLLAITKQLLIQADSTGHSVFYINGPEALICSAPFIEREGKTVYLKKGPGGPLHAFLESCRVKGIEPVFVVNYTRFTPSDMVKFNSVLDTVEPRADGTLMPAGSKVIGLMNVADPNAYMGADFHSRFHEKYDNPLSEEALFAKSLSSAAAAEDNLATPPFVIELFSGPDWKSQLLGGCRLKGEGFDYQEGVLNEAIKTGLPLLIKNGPWDNPEFADFWEHLTIGEGVYHAGQWIKMPASQAVLREDGYAWDPLKNQVGQISSGLELGVKHCLNPNTLSLFLGGYEYDESTQKFTYSAGLIALSKPGSTLTLNVTRSLTEDFWARLLSECQKYDIKLSLNCAANIVLPEVFGYAKPAIDELKDFELNDAITPSFDVIISSDKDVTAAMIKDKNPSAEVLSVSGLEPEDLLYGTNTHFDQEAAKLSLERTVGPLVEKNKAGVPLILTGDFSPKMVDALAAFIFSQDEVPQITFISEDPNALACFSEKAKRHTVMLHDKMNYLPLGGTKVFSKEKIDKEPLSELKARLDYLADHNYQSEGDEAWLGMHHLENHINVDDRPLDFSKTQAQALAFKEERIQSVCQVLNRAPYAYLTGLTGVGKTTFVEQTFSAEKGYNLFHEASGIIAWATAKGKTNPVLFLDEANMSGKDWAIFEGLFQDPPYLIEKGVYYPLSLNHKIIFAGNPSSYGDERKKNPFFERHGGAVLFQPLSKAFLYEEVLTPIFNEQGFDVSDIQTASVALLNAYALLCKNAVDEVLIAV